MCHNVLGCLWLRAFDTGECSRCIRRDPTILIRPRGFSLYGCMAASNVLVFAMNLCRLKVDMYFLPYSSVFPSLFLFRSSLGFLFVVHTSTTLRTAAYASASGTQPGLCISIRTESPLLASAWTNTKMQLYKAGLRLQMAVEPLTFYPVVALPSYSAAGPFYASTFSLPLSAGGGRAGEKLSWLASRGSDQNSLFR